MSRKLYTGEETSTIQVRTQTKWIGPKGQTLGTHLQQRNAHVQHIETQKQTIQTRPMKAHAQPKKSTRVILSHTRGYYRHRIATHGKPSNDPPSTSPQYSRFECLRSLQARQEGARTNRSYPGLLRKF